MAAMTVRFREIATGLASCVLLAPAGCKPPSANVSVDPEPDGEPTSKQPAKAECKTPPRPAPGSSDDTDPPALVNGRFVARDRVQLTFTEPLGPVPPEQVNPRQFRLSSAYSSTDYQAGYASGYYYDLGGNDSYQPAIVVISLGTYEGQPEVLTLQLNRPVPIDTCLAIRERQATIASTQGVDGSTVRARTGVFLHYTSRGSEGVRDRAHNPMGDMGGEWALHFGARQRNSQGTAPVMRLDLLLELGCPDESMQESGPPGPT
jgi:hypothetical protein